MKKKVLIVDDEWNMRNLLKIYLVKDYDIVEARGGQEAIHIMKTSTLDLIVLDIMMPVIDGWEVCKQIRNVQSTPILMLTARSELKEKVYGLEIGADDYLIKPFEPEELIARVNALIRRSGLNKEKDDREILIYSNGYLQIDQETYTVVLGGERLDLTPKEYELLYTLAANPKRVFSREVLLDILWGFNNSSDTRTIDTHIKNIRVKIRDKGFDYNPIQTVWGIGYKFQDADEVV
ncbi:response regulator transcription factor [Bacillus capparidis]|uniref:Two-component system response regulator ResD n=1 Tax=Bacillus capparidis TaxID=1840411 RepID=A0ABS4CRJ9_9BACI|nr:response regulator transcription factor [Bacillus capparidis]MBP1080207.1 two-component system response regulator ResD [Bacillus capparidis]MED1094079.1 response regulator transcription factor [Bacillus capparidis]